MITLFIATSLDGFIADKNGSVDFLQPWEGIDTGYNAFLATVDILLLGRSTFDQACGLPGGWPYASKEALVVTSRPLFDPPAGAIAVPLDIDAIVRRVGTRHAWLVGGARLIAPFFAARAVDRIDLFLAPVLLGRGVPLAHVEQGLHMPQSTWDLVDTATFDKGLVRLRYTLQPPSSSSSSETP